MPDHVMEGEALAWPALIEIHAIECRGVGMRLPQPTALPSYHPPQDPVARFFWSINFTGRTLLNKALPALFHPHSFMLVQVRRGGSGWALLA